MESFPKQVGLFANSQSYSDDRGESCISAWLSRAVEVVDFIQEEI
jgi:hypothetical protein